MYKSDPVEISCRLFPSPQRISWTIFSPTIPGKEHIMESMFTIVLVYAKEELESSREIRVSHAIRLSTRIDRRGSRLVES